eukprot:6214609-Pleurochrysis_carterae.AAC.5
MNDRASFSENASGPALVDRDRSRRRHKSGKLERDCILILDAAGYMIYAAAVVCKGDHAWMTKWADAVRNTV